MHKRLLNTLNEEHAGFSGLTHWLIAICLFLLIWSLPFSFASNYVKEISTSGIFAFLIFLVIGGASLLPDLDSSPLQEGGSTAVYQLGWLGQSLSIISIVISSTVWNILHTKYDDRPPSQHRMFFHAPVVAIGFFFFNAMAYPNDGTTASSLGTASVPASVYAVMFFAALSVYLGSSIFFYKVLSLINKQKHTQFMCIAFMVWSVFTMWKMPFSRLKLIGTAVSLGYLFHIIPGDLVTKGSAPIFFPIPTPVKTSKGIKWRFWWKPYPFNGRFHITTGGAVNIVLNFILMGLDLFLAWSLFKG